MIGQIAVGGEVLRLLPRGELGMRLQCFERARVGDAGGLAASQTLKFLHRLLGTRAVVLVVLDRVAIAVGDAEGL